MAKAAKETVFFVSSAPESNYFYSVRRNKKKSKGEKKLSVRKYDPVVRQHVAFEQKAKLPKLKK